MMLESFNAFKLQIADSVRGQKMIVFLKTDGVPCIRRAEAAKLSGMVLLGVTQVNQCLRRRTMLRTIGHCYLVLCAMVLWPFIASSLFGQTSNPPSSDGIQYVSPKGSDSNNGLSWGTAKATLEGAVAAINATRDGGRIYVAPGNFSWSNTVTLSKPVRLECAPGKATHFTYTGTSGAAIKIAWGAGKDGAGVFGCYFTGSGADTSASAIQISDSSSYVSGAVIENVFMGAHNTRSSGFGTGIDMPTNSRETQNIQIVNTTLLSLGTGVKAYGEQINIRGGSISECATSVNVQTDNTEVTSVGTSYDTDTEAYIVVHGGIFTSLGDHYETNPASLTGAGFIENGGRVTLVGGTMMDDLRSGTQPTFISNTGSTGFLFVLGTTAWSGGQAVSYLAIPPPSGSVDGVIGFDNLMSDTRTPQWPSSGHIGAGRLTVIPSHTHGVSYAPHFFYNQTLEFGGYNGSHNMATLDAHALKGNYTYTFPNSGGQLALSGPNGVSAGTIKMDGGRGLHRFVRSYSSAPVCVASDATSGTAVKVDSTTDVISVTGNGSDTVSWVCTPVAN